MNHATGIFFYFLRFLAKLRVYLLKLKLKAPSLGAFANL